MYVIIRIGHITCGIGLLALTIKQQTNSQHIIKKYWHVTDLVPINYLWNNELDFSEAADNLDNVQLFTFASKWIHLFTL